MQIERASAHREPLLACRGLTRPPVLDGIDLDLDAGEILVLRAPSGAGKTLLLRAIADLDPARAETLALGGRTRDSLPGPEWRKAVRYVHPGGVRLGERAGDGARRVAALRSVRDDPARGEAALVRCSIPDKTPVAHLSSGEAQVVALARAFLGAPRVLLLDEATEHMDAVLAAGWERRVAAFAAGGGAALWASHDDGLAVRLGAPEVTLDELSP